MVISEIVSVVFVTFGLSSILNSAIFAVFAFNNSAAATNSFDVSLYSGQVAFARIGRPRASVSTIDCSLFLATANSVLADKELVVDIFVSCTSFRS